VPPGHSDALSSSLIVGSSSFFELVEKARLIARSPLPVLIQGESGTGKELLGSLIHESSPRRKSRFIKVNCAAFSESLAETEFFGHEKGAFTGADLRHFGCFERADGGSLLLDEIGEMPLRMQAKLLRVLEEGTFDRVGGEEPVTVDVRVIATTNRDLEQEVARGQFRRDLFYRLNAMPLNLLPLRLRPQDIPLLVQAFIDRYGASGTQRVISISPRALEMLVGYSWPGNVRQLRNVVQHACVLAQSDCIQPADLPDLHEPPKSPLPTPGSLTLAEVERRLILDTLRELGGNQTAAALRLGVTARTLQNKLKKYRQDSLDPINRNGR
jgi:two-component system, NtrC family, response regulator HydG